MKTSIFTLFIFALSIMASAQAPNKFQYQTVVRDNAGQPIANQSVSLRMNIHEGSAGGTVVYSETHTLSTNDFGLVSLQIGGGTIVSGTMAGVDWGANEFHLETELDASGGSSYVSMGTSQLLSVPYALSSGDKVWEKDGADISYSGGNVGIGLTSPTNTFSVLQPIGNANSVRFESSDHPAGKDLLELIVPSTASNTSQFIEFQKGSSIVAAIDADGSAKFEDITFGDNTVQTTAAIGPIAFGSISSAAAVSSGSGGYTVTYDNANSRYEITITGESYHFSNYTTVVTPASSTVKAVRTSSVGGKLLVYLYNSAGTQIQGNFHFVVYK